MPGVDPWKDTELMEMLQDKQKWERESKKWRECVALPLKAIVTGKARLKRLKRLQQTKKRPRQVAWVKKIGALRLEGRSRTKRRRSRLKKEKDRARFHVEGYVCRNGSRFLLRTELVCERLKLEKERSRQAWNVLCEEFGSTKVRDQNGQIYRKK
ncbi:hypothetical protein BSKO_06240 [Bryopsis sp. KO-2023]|nr:hypothetical protein BSKO_06240 [Bryopsis sp. KO-2023]